MNAVAEKEKAHPIERLRTQFEERGGEFKAALPAHIPVERFMRVVMTAVQRNPDLLHADRITLFNSALQAASDGLLPDGREGALVIYKTKVNRNGREEWIKAVQWMPMVAGLLKKIRNSGELSSIVARVVYAGDKFRNWIDDDGEHIEYEAGENQDRNVVRCVFAMAKLKDGAIEVEPLTPADIEKIRSVSRSKDKGPWVDWWDEMAKKSAIRRLAKRLPISTDLDDLIRRDDALYDFEGARAEAAQQIPRGLSARLDLIANNAPRAIGGTVEDYPADEAEEPGPTEAARKDAGAPAKSAPQPQEGAPASTAKKSRNSQALTAPAEASATGPKAGSKEPKDAAPVEQQQDAEPEPSAGSASTSYDELIEKYEAACAAAATVEDLDKATDIVTDALDEMSLDERTRIQNTFEAHEARIKSAAAPAEEETDEVRQLRETARAKAKLGSKRLKLWRGALSAEHEKLLAPIADELNELAAYADSKGGE